MSKKNKHHCPDCDTVLEPAEDLDTDWYGKLTYFNCHNCKEGFVSRNGGPLELSAEGYEPNDEEE